MTTGSGPELPRSGEGAPAQLSDDPVTRDPPPFLQPVPRPVRPADQAPDQGQALQRGHQVVAEVGIAGRELLGIGRGPRLGQLQIRLDRLAQALVAVDGTNLGFGLRIWIGLADHGE